MWLKDPRGKRILFSWKSQALLQCLAQRRLDSTTLRGLSCIFKNVAIWLRKQMFCLVSDTSVFHFFIWEHFIRWRRQISAESHAMLMSHAAEEETQQQIADHVTRVYASEITINHTTVELTESKSDFRHTDGVKLSIKYFTENWRSKNPWKSPTIGHLVSSEYYGKLLRSTLRLCILEGRRFLGGSSAKDKRNPCWILSQQGSHWRIMPLVIFSQ